MLSGLFDSLPSLVVKGSEFSETIGAVVVVSLVSFEVSKTTTAGNRLGRAFLVVVVFVTVFLGGVIFLATVGLGTGLVTMVCAGAGFFKIVVACLANTKIDVPISPMPKMVAKMIFFI